MFNCCCSNNVDDFDEKNNEFKAELLDTDFFLNSNSEIQNKQDFKYGIDFVYSHQGAQNGCFRCKKQVCNCSTHGEATDPKTYNEEKKFFKLFFTKEAIEGLDGNFLKLNDDNKLELKTLEKKKGGDVVCFYFDKKKNVDNKEKQNFVKKKEIEQKKDYEIKENTETGYIKEQVENIKQRIADFKKQMAEADKKNFEIPDKIDENFEIPDKIDENFEIPDEQNLNRIFSEKIKKFLIFEGNKKLEEEYYDKYFPKNRSSFSQVYELYFNGSCFCQISKKETEKLNKKLKSLKEEIPNKNRELSINGDIVLPVEQKEVIKKDNNVSENNKKNEDEMNTNSNKNNIKNNDIDNESSNMDISDEGLGIGNINKLKVEDEKNINAPNTDKFSRINQLIDEANNINNKKKQNIDYTKYSYTITVKNSENKKIEFRFSDNAVEKTEGNVFELMDYNNSVNGRQDTIYENGVFFIDYVDEKDEKKENKEFDDKNYVDKTVEKEENKKKLLVLNVKDGIKFCFGKGIRENEELFSVDDDNFIKKQFHFSSPLKKDSNWCSCFSLENEHENEISKT